MKKQLFLFLMCLASLTVQAQTVTKVDGIRYLIEDDHAVVGRQDVELSGDIVIPASINYNGTDYNVTALVEPTRVEFFGDNTVNTENGAFQGCAITGITLPSSIMEVTAGAFMNCAQLVSVSLPDGLTTLAPGCFANCTSLKSVDLPSTVNDLGSNGNNSYVFGGCTSLETVNIPEGVTRIMHGCFQNTAVREFVLPVGLTELGNAALASTALESVTMGVRDLRQLSCSETVFADVSSAALNVPKGSRFIYSEHEPWMFFSTIEEYGDWDDVIQPDQRNIEVNGVKYLLRLTNEGCWAEVKRQAPSLSGSIIIPEYVNFEGYDYPVNYIVQPRTTNAIATGEIITTGGAFQGTQITRVTVPGSIGDIPAGTFADCKQLVKAELIVGVQSVGAGCFAGCENLTEVMLPESLRDLGGNTEFGYRSYVFGGCTSLKTLTIPEGVTRLGNGCFKGSGIETLTIPVGLAQFDDYSLEMPSLKILTLMEEDRNKLTVAGRTFGFGESKDFVKQVDLIVPLGSAQVYREYYPWHDFHSVSDVNCPYLKLNGSVVSAPTDAFVIEDDTPTFEYHDGNYDEVYTHGLCVDTDTKVHFTAAKASWVYIYLFCSNGSRVTLDGEEVREMGDNQCENCSYYRYDKLVQAGEHTIGCNGYEGNQVPVMFLLRVEDATASHRFEPAEGFATIDGVRYILNMDDYTATIARQNKSLGGDIVVPEKVRYEDKEYTVTTMVAPTFEVAVTDGVYETVDGAFQDCQISSVSLPKTLKTIGVGAFNNCQQLHQVTLAEGIEVLGAASFANCTSLEEIYLPETITDLGSETDYGYWSYVFGGCTSLKKVNTPKLVTQLGQGCFKGSGIETFLIPENIKVLAPYCFAAESLKNIKICHKTLTAESITYTESNFADVSDIELIVPEGKTELYSNFYPWKSFGETVEFTEQNDEHQFNAYRVSIEDAPAASRGRRAVSADGHAVDCYLPSGVAVADIVFPERVEKDGVAYIVEQVSDMSDSYMPARDIKLKATLTEVGDADKNGKVDIVDLTYIISHLKNETPASIFLKAADVDGDSNVDENDIVPLVEKVLKK